MTQNGYNTSLSEEAIISIDPKQLVQQQSDLKNSVPIRQDTMIRQNFQGFQTNYEQNTQNRNQHVISFPTSDHLPQNFEVFQLSSDQLQSEATKAQIKSLLDLEPDSISPTKLTPPSLPHREPIKMSKTVDNLPDQNNNDNEKNQPKPFLVNAKQYHRILKRREQREKLIRLGLIPKTRKKYLHESRHRHAMMRNRSEGGRFNRGSTKTKLQALKNCEERKKLKEMEEQERLKIGERL